MGEGKMKNLKKQKGFTVVEITFVMGLMAIIGGLAFNEIRYAVEEQRGLEGINGIRQIYVGSLLYFSSNDHRSNSGITIAKLCTNGYVQRDVCGSSLDGTGQAPWGGNYSISGSIGTENAGVTIYMSNVPTKGGNWILLEVLKDITVDRGNTSYDETNQAFGVTYYSSI